MISQETIDEVLNRASILDFAAELGTVRRQGKNVVSICPFHSEKSPSFHVRDDGKFYYCFGCGASGNSLGFLMKTKGITFPDAIRMLANQYGIPIKETKTSEKNRKPQERESLKKINEAANRFFVEQLKLNSKIAHGYLKERGISIDTAKIFSLGFAPTEWRKLSDYLLKSGFSEQVLLKSGLVRKNSRGELYDLFRGRLIFPIFSTEDQIVAFGGRLFPHSLLASNQKDDNAPKYINSPESPLYIKSETLFAMNLARAAARKSGEIYLVEGYFDVASFYQYGMTETVATCGTALTEKHVQILSRTVNRVNLIFDGDKAGQDAAAKSYPNFVNSGLDVKAIFLPKGQDPDQFAQIHKENLRQELKKVDYSSLFDCYLGYLARNKGYQILNEIPAEIKGSIAKELAQVLIKVENPIEKDELFKRAAFLLNINQVELSNLALNLKPQNYKNNISLDAAKSDPDSKDGLSILSDPRLLPPLEQLLVRCLMVQKQKAILKFIQHPDLVSALSPTVSFFLESFQRLLCENVSNKEIQRQGVQQLLNSLGSAWRTFWEDSYRMSQDPDVSFDRMFEECLNYFEQANIKKMILELKQELARVSFDSRKVQFSSSSEPNDPTRQDLTIGIRQSILELERRLKGGGSTSFGRKSASF